MAEFDVEAFVAQLHGMGLKLSAIPLADGSFRIGRWRMVNAADDDQIQEFWASHIGDNQRRIDALAAHLAKKMSPIVSSGPYRPASAPPAPAPETVAPVEASGQTATPAAAESHDTTIAQSSTNIQVATASVKMGGPQPSTGVPKTPLSGPPKGFKFDRPGLRKPSGLNTGSVLPRPAGLRSAATVSRPTGTPAGAVPTASTLAAEAADLRESGSASDSNTIGSEPIPHPPVAADGSSQGAAAPSGGSNEPDA
jgi:hypothetical protein